MIFTCKKKTKHGTCDDPFLYFEILLNCNLSISSKEM